MSGTACFLLEGISVALATGFRISTEAGDYKGIVIITSFFQQIFLDNDFTGITTFA
jgi:hypothetical protein